MSPTPASDSSLRLIAQVHFNGLKEKNSVHLSGLQLLASDLNRWRANSEASGFVYNQTIINLPTASQFRTIRAPQIDQQISKRRRQYQQVMEQIDLRSEKRQQNLEQEQL
ncbi:hypothetical protein [Argonema antarcticum]|uniref:hypothetical protein n=1 Tax=Argonema antarcticum TaxID=2942763 RepID=UPI0020126CBC|nr:hypothetical protein [Argonema antarcticum]MCL1472873.1 hypothetical protein [Argonema antarcticum A004/B2]